MQKPSRIFEIDLLKAFAIAAVILIHSTSTSFQFYQPYSSTWLVILVFDQILRFSVPLFVALSGYLLALKYLQSPLTIKEFFKRRVLRIFPQYLFWTLVIFLYLHFLTQEPNNSAPIWKIILLGKADYHLYFVPMIFQLYLLFPLILKAYKKTIQITLLAALVLQSIFYALATLINFNLIKINLTFGDQQQYLLFPVWIFYFVLGIFFADTLERKKASKALKIISISFFSGGFLLLCLDTFSTYSLTQNLNIATRFTRFPVLIFATGAISTSLIYKDYLLKIPRVLFQPLKWFGQKSYSIYLLHTIIIRVVYDKIQTDTPLKLAIFAAFVIFLSYTTAHLTNDLAKLPKKLLARVS